MKILLMGLPFYRFMGSCNNVPRLGLGYLSAILRKGGHEVLQYNPDHGTEYGSQKELFDSGEKFMDEITRPYHPAYVETFKMIDEISPDVVGFTILSGTVIQAEIVAKYCSDRGIRTIAGGPMVTLALDKIIENRTFDQLVPGEAETVIKRVIDHPERRVVMGTPTNRIDSIPFPDRGNFVGNNSEMFYGALITSRGCPYQCKYCAHWIMGGEIRVRKPALVVKEMVEIVEQFGTRKFRFFDDTFTMQRSRVFDICQEIRKVGMDVDILVETRADCMDEAMIRELKYAGMNSVKIGIESGSPRILKIYKSGITVEKIRRVVRDLRNNEVGVTLNWMFGFPEETNDDLQASIDLARELESDWDTISSLSPYYGTDMFDLLDDKAKKDWKYFYHTMKVPVMNPGLDPELIEEFLSINDERKWGR